MPIQDIDTFGGNAEALLIVIEHIQMLKSKLSFSRVDARIVALDNCEAHASAVVMIQKLFGSVEDMRFSRQKLAALMGTDSLYLEHDARCLDDLLRLGFLILYQFQVENLFRDLIIAITGIEPPTSWNKLAKDFLSRISIADRDRSFNTLNVLAILRNSYHSNGIHNPPTKKSEKIVIGTVEYDFVYGDRVSCAGWAYIVHAIHAGLDVLEEILFSKEIVALSSPVNDRYASLVAPPGT